MLEWITSTMQSLGYVGIGLMMFLENLFPPIPSEVIMPLAGVTVAQGELNLIGVIFAGVLGTILGALPWYIAGHALGGQRLRAFADRHGKWLRISAKDIDKAQSWFDRYGNRTVFYGRLVPGVRTLISVPAGSYSMPMIAFLLYSTLGTLLWVTLLTGAGYFLGDNYQFFSQNLALISKGVLIILIVGSGIWVAKRHLSAGAKR